MNHEIERKFFGKQFDDSYNKTFNNLKKNLESFIEGNHLDQESSYTSDSEEEQAKESVAALHYQNQRVEVPLETLSTPFYRSLSWG